jgi:hypothetical protein
MSDLPEVVIDAIDEVVEAAMDYASARGPSHYERALREAEKALIAEIKKLLRSVK